MMQVTRLLALAILLLLAACRPTTTDPSATTGPTATTDQKPILSEAKEPPTTTPASIVTPTAAPDQRRSTPIVVPSPPERGQGEGLQPPTGSPRPSPQPSPRGRGGETVVTPTVVGGRSAGDPKAPELGNTGYDVDRYWLQLTLNPTAKRLEGRATIEATATLDRLGQTSLDFADGMAIGSVTVEGHDVPWQYTADKLIVTLPRPLGQGEAFTVTVAYGGPMRSIKSRYVNFADVGMQVRDDGSVFVMGEPDGARTWFPANDTPLDKARFRFDITVPRGLVASATGVQRQTWTTGDTTQSIWVMEQPMAPYLANVMVAAYDLIEGQSPQGVPLRHYVPAGRRDELAPLLAVSGPALDWLAARLGPYPYPQFGYTVVGLPGASLESQSNVLLSDKMLNENTLVHELVHQWLGDSVSLASWADIWRNEGFATYLTLLWEHRDGDAAAIERALSDWEKAMVERPTDYPLGDPPAERLFATDSYIKGAWLAHMLRQRVGDETFYRALRTYLERYRGRAASRAEFEAVFSEVAGQDLSPVFDYWLDRRGLPSLDVTWTSHAGGGDTTVEVQVCGMDLPPSPAEVAMTVQGDAATQPARLPLRNGGRVQVGVPFMPTGVAFDPTEQVLARETVTQVVTLAPCGG